MYLRPHHLGAAAIALFLVSVPLASAGESRPIEFCLAATGSAGSSWTSALILDAFSCSDAFPGAHMEQRLTLRRDSGLGLRGGILIPLTGALGIEIAANLSGAGISGENEPYHIQFTYISGLPRGSLPHEEIVDERFDWVPTTGRIRAWSLSAGLRGRVGIARGVSATASAGAAIERLAGTFGPIAYREYYRGAHWILFSREYMVTARIPTILRPGLAWSLGFEIRVAARVSMVAQADGVITRRVRMEPEFRLAVAYDTLEPVADEIASEIKAGLELPVLNAPAPPLGLSLGWRFRLGE